jgi:hypothetical protein
MAMLAATRAAAVAKDLKAFMVQLLNVAKE